MRYLLVSTCALLLMNGISMHAQEVELTIVYDDYAAAAAVFVGPDSDMPIDGHYYIAIQPRKGVDGHVIVPATVADALIEMKRSLPHWYLNALIRSSNDQECVVTIDARGDRQVDYAYFLNAWFWINWSLDDASLAIRRDLARLGLRTKMQISSAFEFGFCKYVKTGDLDHAVAYMRRYTKTLTGTE